MQIIKKQFEENEKLLLVNIAWEELNVSDTYDDNGQKIDSATAGDSLDLLTIKAVEIANKELKNEDDGYDSLKEDDLFSVGDNVSAYEDSAVYDNILTCLKSSCVEGEDYALYNETVTGYTYWDGHNNKTITIAQPNYEPSHKVLEGEEYDKMIAEYETAKEIKEGFGFRVLESENFIYTENNFAGTFEKAVVETIENYHWRIAEQNRENENA